MPLKDPGPVKRTKAGQLLAFAAVTLAASSVAGAGEPRALHDALDHLARDGRLSGSVVIYGAEGNRFARGYGMADPFADRPFTPDTPVDSASLAKPVTAAAILLLAREGRIDLDAQVRRYLPEYPHTGTRVRHLLAHSAGLPFDDSPSALAGKSNAALLSEVHGRGIGPLFAPGSAFTYCNLCHVALALLIERVTGTHYLDFVRGRVALPSGVTLRPQRLADWAPRAIGYRRTVDGRLDRFDSWEGEAFFGSANLSISARQLAQWGTRWWQHPLAAIRGDASAPARIAGERSGLSWGNWYCAPGRRRCHYLGHHQGFHHMLYWDADRRISVAMLSNNSLAPALQQRLQRAIVRFAEGRPGVANRELAVPLPDAAAEPGRYRLLTGEQIEISSEGGGLLVRRRGIDYPAYPAGSGIRYVPGLDLYIAGSSDGHLHWLTLYEDFVARRTGDRR